MIEVIFIAIGALGMGFWLCWIASGALEQIRYKRIFKAVDRAIKNKRGK